MKTINSIRVLNEVEGLQAIMPIIKKEWVDQILIVDGCSEDVTFEYLKNINCEYIVQKRRMLRHAYSEALPHIRKKCCDNIQARW